MMNSQYMRIERQAGGSNCTDREFIRAAYLLLSPLAKTRGKRKLRQEWIRRGLALKAKYN